MKQEHEIVAQVYEAKESSQAADLLVKKYLPFIKAEAARFTHKNPMAGQEDELSIAMFAFHEAVLSYRKGKGAFLSFASLAIRNRLIDYQRKEQRHKKVISFDRNVSREEEERSLLDKIDTGTDEMKEHTERSSAREEILEFSKTLSGYGLSLSDIADNCPRQKRTLEACHRALAYAKEYPQILDSLMETRKLPMNRITAGSGVDRKTLERHRKYMVGILLAYTNGFEIIRGHLRQVAPVKGGQSI